MVFSIFGALAEFERSLTRERTEAGLAAAHSRGRILGRPSVMTLDRTATARAVAAAGTPVARIAATLGVGRVSVYRALAGFGAEGAEARALDTDQLALLSAGSSGQPTNEAIAPVGFGGIHWSSQAETFESMSAVPLTMTSRYSMRFDGAPPIE